MTEQIPAAPAASEPSAGQARQKKKRTAAGSAISFFIKLGLTALLVWLLLTFVAGIYICHTNSAYPTIRDGEFCLTYRLADLKQGTMFVYKHDGEVKFGRVIAFGGEQVEIYPDYIAVNGYGITDNAVYSTSPEGSAVSYPYSVPENCVFVMNDYRSDLSDSRTQGGIPLSDVQGAVIFTMRMRGI